MDLKFGGRGCLSSVELNGRKHRSVPRKFLSPGHHTLVVSSRNLHLTQTGKVQLHGRCLADMTPPLRVSCSRILYPGMSEDILHGCVFPFGPSVEKVWCDCGRVDGGRGCAGVAVTHAVETVDATRTLRVLREFGVRADRTFMPAWIRTSSRIWLLLESGN